MPFVVDGLVIQNDRWVFASLVKMLLDDVRREERIVVASDDKDRGIVWLTVRAFKTTLDQIE